LPDPQQRQSSVAVSSASQDSAFASRAFGTPTLNGAEDVQEANTIPEGSVLPVISIIGFGLLCGGIVSALKTRG
jgi:hypothetical protein